MKNITIVGKYHHKNLHFLKQLCNDKNYFNFVPNIQQADVVLSANLPINIEKYPDKYFIFGPHFSVFPNKEAIGLKNTHNNACYIQPSEPSVNTWLNEFNYKALPVFALPFGVDVDTFKDSAIPKTKVLVYHKSRNPAELKQIIEFLKTKQIDYKLFSYKKRYKEGDYKNYLKECKYGIWIGGHESQGFALEEALASNVPLLVWNVKLRNQEWPPKREYVHIKSNVSSIPYWNDSCGESFYSFHEIEDKYNKLITNLENYKPREFILNNLSIDKLKKVWFDFIMSKIN